MSRMKELATDICGDTPWDPDWALASLLGPGEIVIKAEHLSTLVLHVDYLINRAKYFNEHKSALPLLTSIQEDLQLIAIGARP